MNEMDILTKSPAMESFITGLMIHQPPKDRLHYREIAMEAVAINPAGKSKMVQKLYQDIVSKRNINFGNIPDSKGNLTAYQEYESIASAIEILNTLIDPKKVKSLQLLNDLNAQMINLRSDFELGFKMNIDIIQLTYNTLVLALHELVMINILAYTEYLKDTNQVDFTFRKTKGTDTFIIKYVDQFLTSVKKGEWAKLMEGYKKDQKALVGVFTFAATTKVKIPVAVKVIAAIIGLFILLKALRYGVYYFYCKAADLEWTIGETKKFLEAAQNDAQNSQKASDRQSKMYNFLSSVSSVIQSKILKTNAKAEGEMEKSDSNTFSVDNLGDGDGSPAYMI